MREAGKGETHNASEPGREAKRWIEIRRVMAFERGNLLPAGPAGTF